MADKVRKLNEIDKEFLKSKTPYALPDNPSNKGFSASQIKAKMYEGHLVVYEWLKQLQAETNVAFDLNDVAIAVINSAIDTINATKATKVELADLQEDIEDGTITAYKATRDGDGLVIASNYGVALSLSYDENTNKITILLHSSDNTLLDTKYITLPLANATDDGLMSSADKAKLTDLPTKGQLDSALAVKVPQTRTILGIDLVDDITLNEVKSAIGEATAILSGLMSATDKARLDALHALLGVEADADAVVSTINEVLAIFNQYPEGADLVSALGGKVDKVAGYGLSKNDYSDGEKAKVTASDAHRQVVSGNPHQVTKSDVGLGNVDNTSDEDKPISTATQTAINELDTRVKEANDDVVVVKEQVQNINTTLDYSKNLANVTQTLPTTVRGITLDYDKTNGIFSVNGIAPAELATPSFMDLFGEYFDGFDETFTLSYRYISGVGAINFLIYNENANTIGFFRDLTNYQNDVFVVVDDKLYNDKPIRFNFAKEYEYVDFKFKIQIEKGNRMTSWVNPLFDVKKEITNEYLFNTGKEYYGQVATRCRTSNSLLASGGSPMNARTTHKAMCNIQNPKVIIPNWYGSENNGGRTVDVLKVSIEYPEGVFTQATFNGNSVGFIDDGDNAITDEMPIFIPEGQTFFTRIYIESSNGSLIWNSRFMPISTDGFEFGSGVTDKTLSGTIPYSSGSNFSPVAIIAKTRRPSFALLGDSRVDGTKEGSANVATIDGYKGDFEPTVSQKFASINMGLGGESANTFISKHSKRLALANYCSHIIINYGINDLSSSVNASTTISRINTITNYFTGKRVYYATLQPVTTSTDNWETIENQTTATWENERILVNNAIRDGLINNVVAYFDLAEAIETYLDSGIWLPKMTVDGVHANKKGIMRILAKEVIKLSYFE